MKIGMLGFGFMGKTHTYAIHNLKFFYKDLPFEAENCAVCTAHLQTGRKKRPVNLVYLVIQIRKTNIIGNDEIDIIDICIPNIYHYETLKKAIAAGKHIYCEKPLCVSYEQAEEIKRLAEEKNLKCQIVFNNRFLAPILRAKEIIDEGGLGRILSFRASYLHASAADVRRNAGWKQDKEICGGGVLFDLGSHAIDLIYYLCGPFASVIGKSQIAYPVRKGFKRRGMGNERRRGFLHDRYPGKRRGRYDRGKQNHSGD